MMNETDTPPQQSAEEAAASFVGKLTWMNRQAVEKGDSEARAKLARLRRSLGALEVSTAALSDVGAWLPDKLSDDQLDAYLLTAALFALNPPPASDKKLDEQRRWTSLGSTLRELRRKLSAGAESLDRRVTALLDADLPDLPYRLRQIIQMLKSNGLAPDYRQLLLDLLRWDAPTRSVQRRWARDYWTGETN